MNQPETPPSLKTELPHENLFKGIANGFHQSIGRLPAPMVIILIIALSVSIISGIGLQFAETNAKRGNYLPLRLSVDDKKPALQPQTLKGIWVYDDDVQTITIQFGIDNFELIQAKKNEPFVRYFVRGGYRTEGNILILQGRKDLGSPYDSNRLELKFLPLEFNTLNIIGEIARGIMLWRIPVSERNQMLPSLQDEFPLADTRPMGFIQVSKQ
jgi:hypothetical protein